TMASQENKGKEVVVTNKGLKWLIKGTKGSKSLAIKSPPARRFEAKVVQEYGLKWFNSQKEAKYAPKNWIDEEHFALEFPNIHETIRELG
ncbi:hypothetical protein HAX54_044149, partial [Datura stramonium]|nr:hypothetical protein [Datura stramonium]